MADKEIVSLPAIPAFRDDALLPCYVPGSTEPAQKMTGAQLREYAERAAANVKKGDKGDPGDVSSVNGVQPDAKGNVSLTPAQVGAAPNFAGSIADTDLLEWARKQTASVCAFCNSTVTKINLPVSASGFAYVFVPNNGGGTTVMYFVPYHNKAYFNTLYSTTWKGWAEIATTDYTLPRDGSAAMTGNLTIESSTNKHFEVRNTTSGRVARTQINSNYAQLNNMTDNNNYSAIVLGAETETLLNILRLRINKTGNDPLFYPIFHTGNKPSNSYTGNGSATARTVDTGGFGSTLRINGNNCVLFVTASGAICKYANNTIAGISGSECNFNSGVLTLATTNEAINKNGTKFYYEVL